MVRETRILFKLEKDYYGPIKINQGLIEILLNMNLMMIEIKHYC